jgi:hypothetical protein
MPFSISNVSGIQNSYQVVFKEDVTAGHTARDPAAGGIALNIAYAKGRAYPRPILTEAWYRNKKFKTLTLNPFRPFGR